MAWVSESRLAAAVSSAGGAGIIASGGRSVEWVRDEIRAAKTLTTKPFGVNIVMLDRLKDEMVALVCEEKVAFVTMGAGRPPVKGIRPVAAVAPGVSASTGLSLQQLAGALVREVRPTALICVDSLCSSEPQRLGRTLQFSDTGLCPAQPGSSKHLDAARLGLPVIAAGIPTLMMAQEGKDLVVTPRELDSVIAHGAALLGAAINRALQPRLSIAQLCWLVG